MIEPKYAINCLKLGFERYKRYSKLPIEIKVSKSTASFYVKKPDEGRGKNARVSNHHPNLQNYADYRNTPWLMDNISIEFIVPDSEADLKRYRARVNQNAEGSIKPFDVTTYQYDPTLIEPKDMYTIFQAIMRFLNGEGYEDPFNGTPKEAKVMTRHSNIKPYRGKPTTESTNKVLSDKYLNEMAYLCIGDYVSILENKNNQKICNKNMNRNKNNVVRLTESELRNMIKESVRKVLWEQSYKPNKILKISETDLQTSLNEMLNEGLFNKIGSGKLGLIVSLIFAAASCQNSKIIDREAAIQQIKQDFAKEYYMDVNEIDTTSLEFKNFVQKELDKLEEKGWVESIGNPGNPASPLNPANPLNPVNPIHMMP